MESTNYKICVVAGMPRAATTFLYHTLQDHPNVFIPSRKETDFFSVNYYRGTNWYLNFFKKKASNQIGFDISPMYFFDKEAPIRMKKFNPAIKVILVIRQPVEWLISLYKRMEAIRIRELAFKNFIDGHIYKKDGKKLKLEFKDSFIKKAILSYIWIFGDNLLLCDYGIFEEDVLYLLKALEKFVSIPNFFNENNFKNVIINTSKEKSSKFINIMMQQKYFVDFITNFFPKNMIIQARYRVQAKGKKKKRKSNKNKRSISEYTKIAETILDDDIKYISQLFRNSKMLLGGGKPFDTSV